MERLFYIMRLELDSCSAGKAKGNIFLPSFFLVFLLRCLSKAGGVLVVTDGVSIDILVRCVLRKLRTQRTADTQATVWLTWEANLGAVDWTERAA